MRLIILLFISINCLALDYQITPEVKYSSELITSGNYQINIHRWKKAGNLNWAMASHGYLDHCLYMKPLFVHLLSKNYNILCYDLPGHGLSSGPQGDIEKFEDYGLVQKDVEAKLPFFGKKIFVGHSTGNVGMIQNLLDPNWQSKFKKIILIAPLTRSFMWNTYQWAINETVVNTIKWIPVVMNNNHVDYKYLVKNDPYRASRLPTHWLWELNQWYLDINESYVNRSISFDVIFGENDHVVDKNYGMLFFEKIFPGAQVFELPDASHMPYYDKEKEILDFFNMFDLLLN